MMIENAVRVLNELLAADPEAVNRLFRIEVEVNQQVRDHPTIQVTDRGALRPLGLFNGLIRDGDRVIVMVTNLSGTTITEFAIGTLGEDGKVKVEARRPPSPPRFSARTER